MGKDDFFDVGYDGIDQELEDQKQRRQKYQEGGKGLRDFWMKTDEENAFVRFLTDEPVVIHRHSFYVNGNWEKPTCLGDPEECPFCKCPDDTVSDKRKEGAHLLVDHREWETKEGNIYKDELKVGVWAASHIASFRKDAEETEEKTLMREWKMTRTGEKAKTTYRLFPKATQPLPEEMRLNFKKVLSKYSEEWKAFKARKKLDKFPIERFAVAMTVAPLSVEEAQKMVDSYMASKGGKSQKKAEEPAKQSTNGKAEPAPDMGDDADYNF